MQALLLGNLAGMLLSHSSRHCWLPAALLPPSTHNIWRGMQQCSQSNKSPSHGDSGEFSHWFQKDPNSTQEKAILNYCPDSASQDRKAEKQLSCRFPSASCWRWGGHSLLLQRDGAEGDAAGGAVSWGSATVASASVQ